jgi:hypothetical protein
MSYCATYPYQFCLECKATSRLKEGMIPFTATSEPTYCVQLSLVHNGHCLRKTTGVSYWWLPSVGGDNVWRKVQRQLCLWRTSPWKTQEKGGTCATRHWTHLDAAPRQRPMSHGSLHQLSVGRKKQSCGSSAPLFTGSQSLWLCFIPPAQKSFERAPFWYFG